MKIIRTALMAAQLAISANDNKVTLVDGVNTPIPNPPPDTVTILAFIHGARDMSRWAREDF